MRMDDSDEAEDVNRSYLGTSLRAFDTYDWSLVSTFDARKHIQDVCLSNDDMHITLVEVPLSMFTGEFIIAHCRTRQNKPTG